MLGPGVRGLLRAGAFDARLALRVSPVYHLVHPFGPFRGFVEAQRPSLGRLEVISHQTPAQSRARFDNPTAASVVPGQFGPLARLAAGMFEEVGIDLVGQPRVRARARQEIPEAQGLGPFDVTGDLLGDHR